MATKKTRKEMLKILENNLAKHYRLDTKRKTKEDCIKLLNAMKDIKSSDARVANFIRELEEREREIEKLEADLSTKTNSFRFAEQLYYFMIKYL